MREYLISYKDDTTKLLNISRSNYEKDWVRIPNTPEMDVRNELSNYGNDLSSESQLLAGQSHAATDKCRYHL